jgi:hypothetical protein
VPRRATVEDVERRAAAAASRFARAATAAADAADAADADDDAAAPSAADEEEAEWPVNSGAAITEGLILVRQPLPLPLTLFFAHASRIIGPSL